MTESKLHLMLASWSNAVLKHQGEHIKTNIHVAKADLAIKVAQHLDALFPNLSYIKTLWLLFMERLELSQGYSTTTRRHFTLTIISPEIPGSYLIDHRRMKGCINLGAG